MLLGIQNVPRDVSSLEEDEKLIYGFRISGQMRKANFISESGLYALIFRSKKPNASKFRKWITKEVISILLIYATLLSNIFYLFF